MKLKSVTIENYRSIDTLNLEITEIDSSYTYSLLGINESGKSSILKAISLIDDDGINYPTDFFDDTRPVIVKLNYELTNDDIKEFHQALESKFKFDKQLISKINIIDVDILIKFEPSAKTKKSHSETINFENSILTDYTLTNEKPVKKDKIEHQLEEDDFNLSAFAETNLPDHFWSFSHYVVFWTSSPKYLMLDEIDLTSFSTNPKEISTPLFNCFALAGIMPKSISSEINKLNSPVAIKRLQSRLSEATTQHINKIWPEHPISISFQINNNKVSLLIEDNEVKFQPKTTGQRSDGFKQFLSFLLTISAENVNNELDNTILLIDEPETHLHPPAQINLLRELVNITKPKSNNIVFFATHSNYLIDKENLDRNYKVFKEKNQKTAVNKIAKKRSTYSEVNFEVFGIISSDYHNELYGFIELEDKNLLDQLPKTLKWKNAKTNKISNVSLSEYIRHSIHHPENELNKRFSDAELKESIETLIKLKNSIN